MNRKTIAVLMPSKLVWKILIVLLLIAGSFIGGWFILLHYNKKYQPFPSNYHDKTYLFKYVKPAKNYKYWAFVEGSFADELNILYSHGIKPRSLKIQDPGGRLFSGCLPLLCYKYVVYLDGGELKYINSDEQLPSFIGDIDNLQEAMLILFVKDFYFDDSYGLGYKQIQYGYEMMVKRYYPCPQKEITYKLYFTKEGLSHTEKISTNLKGGCVVY